MILIVTIYWCLPCAKHYTKWCVCVYVCMYVCMCILYMNICIYT